MKEKNGAISLSTKTEVDTSKKGLINKKFVKKYLNPLLNEKFVLYYNTNIILGDSLPEYSISTEDLKALKSLSVKSTPQTALKLKEFYVDSNGNDNNPGTLEAPKASLQACINKCTTNNTKYIFKLKSNLAGKNAQASINNKIIEILSYPDTEKRKLNADINSPALTVDANSNLSIKNLHIGSKGIKLNNGNIDIASGITFDENEGISINTDNSAIITINERLTEPIQIKPTKYKQKQIVQISGNVNIKNKFKLDRDGWKINEAGMLIAKKYSVTYNSNDGTNASDNPLSYTVEDTPITLKPATRTGFDFIGWKDSSNNIITQIKKGSTGNKNLTAQWKAKGDIQYTVQHWFENLNGKYEHKDEYHKTAYGTTNTEVGDCTNIITGEVPKGFESGIQDPATPKNTKIQGNGTTVIRINHKRKIVTLTINPNGGKLEDSTNNKILTGKYESPVSKTTDPIKLGYTFKGWNIDGKELPTAFPPEDKTYTAQWAAITYAVKFLAGTGATGSMQEQTFTYDVSQKLKANTFSKAGYEFTNWSGSDGNTYTNGQNITTNLASTQGATITLTAQWRAVEVNYTVKHYFEKLSYGYEYDQDYDKIESGTTDTQVGDCTTKIGKALPEGFKTGVHYTSTPANTTINGDSSTVIKIKHNRKRVTLTFKKDDGIIIDNNGIPEGTSVTADKVNGSVNDYIANNKKYGSKHPITAEYTGYAFQGWRKEGSSDTPKKRIIAPAKNTTYIAIWKPSNTTFKVEHWLEKIEGENKYEHKSTYDKTVLGTTGTQVGNCNGIIQGTVPQDYVNTEQVTPTTTTINGDGSTVVRINHKLKRYEITLKRNGGEIKYKINGGSPIYISSGYNKTIKKKKGTQIEIIEVERKYGKKPYKKGGWKIFDGSTTTTISEITKTLTFDEDTNGKKYKARWIGYKLTKYDSTPIGFCINQVDTKNGKIEVYGKVQQEINGNWEILWERKRNQYREDHFRGKEWYYDEYNGGKYIHPNRVGYSTPLPPGFPITIWMNIRENDFGDTGDDWIVPKTNGGVPGNGSNGGTNKGTSKTGYVPSDKTWLDIIYDDLDDAKNNTKVRIEYKVEEVYLDE